MAGAAICALVGLAAPALAATAAAAPADEEENQDDFAHALEARMGALVPSQVLDGASLHLTLAYRYRLTGPLWLHLEGGANRTRITALTRAVPAPGGAVTLRADHEQWTLPMVAGVGLQGPVAAGARWGAVAAAGAAWSAATLRSSVVGGPKLGVEDETRFDLLGLARVDLTWPVRPGLLVVGVGWQEVFTAGDDRTTGDVRASGLLLEGGWRAHF